MNFLKPYEDQIYAASRIAIGFLFACHGAQKVLGLFGGPPAEVPAAIIWTAGPIELVGGLMIAFGVFTSLAAFICSGQMAIAYFLAHQKDGLLPIENRGELAALYAWIFLVISTKGAGIWSVDASRAGS